MRTTSLLALATLGTITGTSAFAKIEKPDFNTHIKPILDVVETPVEPQ